MPTLFYLILLGIFGLLIGSFSNVLILRDDRRESIVSGRSECPNCKHLLSWYELIPVISFIAQVGICRHCHKRISPQYPAVELISALLWLGAAYYGLKLHNSIAAAVLLGFCFSAFLVISVIDIRTQLVSLEYCVVAGTLGFASRLVLHDSLVLTVLGGLAGAAVIGGVLIGWKRLTGQDGMGEGDVWIAGAVGLAAGWPMIGISLLFAVFLGSLVGIGYVVIVRKGLKIRMPFGPFLATGLVLSLFWGQNALNWYILQLQ